MLTVNGFDKGCDFEDFLDLVLPQWNICFKNKTYMHMHGCFKDTKRVGHLQDFVG